MLRLVTLLLAAVVVVTACDDEPEVDAPGGSAVTEFSALRERVLAEAKDQLPALATALDATVDTAEGASQERVAATIGGGTYAYAVESWMTGPAPKEAAMARAVEALGYTDVAEKADQVTGTSPDGDVSLTVTHRTLSGEPPVFIVTLGSTQEVRMSADEVRQARAEDLLGTTDDLRLGSGQPSSR